MKKVILVLVVLLNSSLFAQKIVESTIKAVNVYKQQASVFREATVSLNPGKNEVVLTGISTMINPESLQVQFSGSSNILLSAKYERNYLIERPESSNITTLKEKIEQTNDALDWNTIQVESLKGMLAVLSKNQDLGVANASFTPSQVVALANTYKAKYLEVQKELAGVNKERKTLKKTLDKYNKQLQEMNGKYNKPSGTIVLKINTQRKSELTIVSKYIVRNAGWKPLYDIRSNGIDKNVKLAYKAAIYQRTGQDWSNVALSISTGNPSLNNNRPILSPLYASIYTPNVNYIQDDVEEVVVSNMALKKELKGKVAGVQTSDGYVYDSSVAQNQLNVVFSIPSKQTILSDGKDNAVAIKQYELTTKYSYHTVPKLDRGAFLIAKISDWSKYNLVAGQANIFFEGAYVGNTYINPQVTSEDLWVSMGRDNSIVVAREPIKDYTASKFIGTNTKETFAYSITVKNKKNKAIAIEIVDQIPLSQNKAITITLDEKTGAKHNILGKLLWKLDIPAGMSKEVSFKYTIKYPKKVQVIGKK